MRNHEEEVDLKHKKKERQFFQVENNTNKKPTSAATISHVKLPLVWEEGRVLEQVIWKFTEAIFCTEK